MKKTLVLIAFLLVCFFGFGQSGRHYVIRYQTQNDTVVLDTQAVNGIHIDAYGQNLTHENGTVWSALTDLDTVYIYREDFENGLFTINANGDQVRFSSGNLYYDGSGFQFEANQWDFESSYNPSHVSHFCWSSNIEEAISGSDEWLEGSFNDVFFTDQSGFTVNGQTGWHTLGFYEWHYLLEERNVNGQTGWEHTCAWATVNGVNGLIIFCDGYVGQITGLTSIPEGCVFLPAAGRRNGYAYDVGSVGYYWSSSPSLEYEAWRLYFCSDYIYDYHDLRYYGQSVRLVCSAEDLPNMNTPIVTTSQVTNITSTTAIGGGNVIDEGSSSVTERGICWGLSSNPTVDGQHSSCGTGTGNFTISMTGLTANTNYYVRAYATNSVGTAYGDEISFETGAEPQDDWVDLGLPSGLLWAVRNVGASSPEDYGDYFAWAEIQPKSVYNWNTYIYTCGDYDDLTKYCNDSYYGCNGYADNLTVLHASDDAATVNWGSDWRIPTEEEWEELLNHCISVWTMQNGVSGRCFIGSNGNSLFLPAAGYRWGDDLNQVGNFGIYWSSSLGTSRPSNAWYCDFSSGGIGTNILYDRINGHSVRAVRSARQK